MKWFREAPSFSVLNASLGLFVPVAWVEFASTIVWHAGWVDRWPAAAYWVAARLMLEGRAQTLYGDGAAFSRESVALGGLPDTVAANAPTTFLSFVPLAPFSIDTARALWALIGLACMVAALVLLLRGLGLGLRFTLAVLAFVPMFEPWCDDVFMGQAYAPLLLFIVAGGIWASRLEWDDMDRVRGSSVIGRLLAGGSFGLACVVKQFYGLVQLLTVLVRRQWTVVVGALAVYGAAVAVTLALLGAGSWVVALQDSLAWRDKPETAVTAYQSLNNFITHLFRYHPTLNPGPVADLPWLVMPLWWSLALAMAGVTAWVALASRSRVLRSPGERLLPYALTLPLALLLAPISEDYHYTLALFPLMVVGAVLWDELGLGRGSGERRWRNLRFPAAGLGVFLLAVLLLSLPWSFANVPGADGWRSFLYYPRFYGTLLLWGLIVALLWRLPHESHLVEPFQAPEMC